VFGGGGIFDHCGDGPQFPAETFDRTLNRTDAHSQDSTSKYALDLFDPTQSTDENTSGNGDYRDALKRDIHDNGVGASWSFADGYDVVIIDTPPVTARADAAIIDRFADTCPFSGQVGPDLPG
jgi:cellulose biosynthesis protein BcsQ